MFARTKTAPTHYPRLPFHGLRTAQLFSSMIVGGIMLYFMYNLRHDHWPLPWTFIVLLAVSLFTVLALTVTIVLHCCFGLNPRFNLFLNSTLLVPWTVGFALLSWWSSGTLTHVCNVANWHDSVGIMVCRIYKALFAFTLFGFLSTVGALILDIVVYRRHTRLGVYNPMQNLGDNKPRASTNERPDVPYGSGGIDADGPQRTASPFVGGYAAGGAYATSTADLSQSAVPRPYKDAPKQGADGYALPDGQFDYDTSYRGAPNSRGH